LIGLPNILIVFLPGELIERNPIGIGVNAASLLLLADADTVYGMNFPDGTPGRTYRFTAATRYVAGIEKELTVSLT
jgi:hypothetical protein